MDGRLVDLAHEVSLRSDGLRAVEPVVLLLLAAVGLVTLAALARLFASTHAQEISLLWARGAAAGSLAGSAQSRPRPRRPSVAWSAFSSPSGWRSSARVRRLRPSSLPSSPSSRWPRRQRASLRCRST